MVGFQKSVFPTVLLIVLSEGILLMFLKSNGIIRKVVSISIASVISLSVTLCYSPFVEKESNADFVKTKVNTTLTTSQIGSPSQPESYESAWSGSYVYYGKSGLKFRVLSPKTSDYGGTTMLLESDNVLFKRSFDDNSNVWDKSELKIYMNNNYIHQIFMKAEENAVFSSKLKSGKTYANDPTECDFCGFVFEKTTGVEGDKLFLLDVADIKNPAYGYSKNDGWLIGRKADRDLMAIPFAGPIIYAIKAKKSVDAEFKKNGEEKEYRHYNIPNRSKNKSVYWLRNNAAISSLSAGVVDSSGSIGADDVRKEYSIAPAMNIDLEKILFVSLISGKEGTAGSEFKLTVYDDDIKMRVPDGEEVSAQGRCVKIPYVLDGDNVSSTNRISVLLLEDRYLIDDANNNTILHYSSLDNIYSEKDGSLQLSGTGTFNLPSNYDLSGWGNKYHVYVFAENINGKNESDFASKLVEIPNIKILDEQAVLANEPSPTPVRLTPTRMPVTPVPTTSPAPTRRSTVPVSLELDKTQADLICEKSLSLKATLKGSNSGVTWKSSDNSIATVDSSGLVKAKKAGNVTITAAAAGKTAKCKISVLYKDVTDYSAFWFEPTYYLTNKEVVKGYDNQTRFKPANKCTRAQMVTFIWRLKGEPAPKSTNCKFSDVKKTDYFSKACIWGNEQGIVEGYKDGTFGPQITCARKHAVTFLWRLAGKPEPVTNKNMFSDVKKGDYFYKATLWASENKILAGYEDGTFRPNGDCLRRQMVTFLYKYDKNI